MWWVQGGHARGRGRPDRTGRLPAACVRFACVLVLLVACAPAWAGLRLVHAGEVPTLADDEGFLLVAVDTHVPLVAALLQGADGTSLTVPALPAGRSHVLMIASGGAYHWEHVDTATTRLALASDPELAFSVEAGR